MPKTTLFCAIKKIEQHIEVQSPSIGRAILWLNVGQILTAGQIIGQFWRLNQQYWLSVAEDCQGVITKVKGYDQLIYLDYNETFLGIDEARSEKINSIPIEREKLSANAKSINAPMDGMFYLSASPEAPPFVNLGDEIQKGQTIGLIEVMKCFYPLKYQGDKNAKIIGVNIKNATPVASGTLIFTVIDL